MNFLLKYKVQVMSLVSLHLPLTSQLHEDLEVTQRWQAYLVIISQSFATVKSLSHIEAELVRRLAPTILLSTWGVCEWVL